MASNLEKCVSIPNTKFSRSEPCLQVVLKTLPCQNRWPYFWWPTHSFSCAMSCHCRSLHSLSAIQSDIVSIRDRKRVNEWKVLSWPCWCDRTIIKQIPAANLVKLYQGTHWQFPNRMRGTLCDIPCWYLVLIPDYYWSVHLGCSMLFCLNGPNGMPTTTWVASVGTSQRHVKRFFLELCPPCTPGHRCSFDESTGWLQKRKVWLNLISILADSVGHALVQDEDRDRRPFP